MLTDKDIIAWASNVDGDLSDENYGRHTGTRKLKTKKYLDSLKKKKVFKDKIIDGYEASDGESDTDSFDFNRNKLFTHKKSKKHDSNKLDLKQLEYDRGYEASDEDEEALIKTKFDGFKTPEYITLVNKTYTDEFATKLLYAISKNQADKTKARDRSGSDVSHKSFEDSALSGCGTSSNSSEDGSPDDIALSPVKPIGIIRGPEQSPTNEKSLQMAKGNGKKLDYSSDGYCSELNEGPESTNVDEVELSGSIVEAF